MLSGNRWTVNYENVAQGTKRKRRIFISLTLHLLVLTDLNWTRIDLRSKGMILATEVFLF